jgi:hypothetical protein
MNATFALHAGLLAVCLTSSTAVAGPYHPQRPSPPPVAYVPALSTLEIDNHTGLLVEVFVDGRFVGAVRDGQDYDFPSQPGTRRVTVKLQDGTVAYDQTLRLNPHAEAEVELGPLLATVVLDNDGNSPLWVTVSGVAPFWLMPDTRQSLQLRPGPVHVDGAVYGPRGLATVVSQDLFARPAATLIADLGWSPAPPSSRVTIHNHERTDVRVYVAGAEIAALRPGSSTTMEVRPGQHQVTVVANHGGILFNDRVSFVDDQVRTVLLRDGRCHDQGNTRWDRGQTVAWAR